MCGIVGIIFREQKPAASDLAQMQTVLEKLAYRGPDDCGVWQDDLVILGHRRLSIIDLSSAGAQPFEHQEQGLVVIYNGEIYNYQDIRRILIGHGYKFRSQTDTEVILHAYDFYGLDFLNHLNGMFAFCLYDRIRKKVLLARDPIGEKPLFYYFDQSKLVFASEIKAFYGFPNIPLDIDLDSLQSYFVLQYIPGEHTIIKQIKEVPPGAFIELNMDNWQLQTNTFWDIFELFSSNQPVNNGEIDRRLETSVRYRLVGDVKMGVLLSGGVDSSLLAYHVMNQGGNLMAFTARFEQTDLDESQFARLVADMLGMELVILDGGSVNRDIYDAVVFHADEPIGDAACIPTFLLAKELSQYVKVVLSGEGADELFFGYDHYRLERLWRKLGRIVGVPGSSPVIRSWMRNIGNRPGIPKSISRLTKLFFNQYDLGATRWTSVFADTALTHLFVNTPNIQTGELDYLSEMQKMLLKLSDATGLPLASLLIDLFYWLPNDLLVKVDRMTMAHSVESRAPYLDPRLVQAAISLPLKEKMNNTKGKLVLRRLIEEKFPNENGKKLAWRKKHGFETPIGEWLKGPLRELAEERLSEQSLADQGLFNSGYVTYLWNSFRTSNGPTPATRRLWLLLCYQSWFEMHKNRFGFVDS